MATLVTGRRIGADKTPVDGTGFEYDSDGPLAALIAQRKSPIISQPYTGEWVFSLVPAQDTNREYERGCGIFPPGNAGPPEHFHPTYAEHFEVIQGNFIFKLNGQERPVTAGETIVVPRGTAHTFRCTGPGYGVAVVETRPAARITEVISTLFGMAHEGILTRQGQPKFLQAMVIGHEYADDTVFTAPPPAVVLTLAKIFAPIGRRLGYRASAAKYLEESFWTACVEQPV